MTLPRDRPRAQPEERPALPIGNAKAYAMAMVCLDLHHALGVEWGDDPYPRIQALLKAEADREAQGAQITALAQEKAQEIAEVKRELHCVANERDEARRWRDNRAAVQEESRAARDSAVILDLQGSYNDILATWADCRERLRAAEAQVAALTVQREQLGPQPNYFIRRGTCEFEPVGACRPWREPASSGLTRYNCDCLNADEHDGTPTDSEQGIYCERWVYLAPDVDAKVAALTVERERLTKENQELHARVDKWGRPVADLPRRSDGGAP